MRTRSLLSLWALALVSKLVLAFNADANNNVAVYWGQNSGGGQQRLSTYCDSAAVDIVLISFMVAYPNVALNFANQCGDTFSDGLLHCPNIGSDIQYCQSQGKKVLLSLGGASGAYGFTSDSQAETFAGTLWNMFGAGSGSEERPFDEAIIDGFDLDIENNNPTGYAALVTKLRQYFAKDSSKTYYISAAPQCPYPDASVGDALANSDIDFAFIQFYNNYCNLGGNFNWDTWLNYATTVSPNSNIKLYLGLPASSTSAGSGYASASTVQQYLSTIKNSPQFGGISLWDVSSGWANTDSLGTNFVQQMKNLLAGASAGTSTSATTSSSSSSSSSSTSSSTTTSSSSSTTISSSSTTTSSTSSTTTSSSSSTTTSSSSSTTLVFNIPSSSSSTSISIPIDVSSSEIPIISSPLPLTESTFVVDTSSAAVPPSSSQPILATTEETEITLSSQTTPVSDVSDLSFTSSTRSRRVVTYAVTETVFATSWVTVPSSTTYSTTTISSVPGFFKWWF